MRFWNRLSLQAWFLLQAGLVFAILFLVFIFLSNDAIASSTQQILSERRLLAEQTARRIDLLLDQSIAEMQAANLSTLSTGEASPSVARQSYAGLSLSAFTSARADQQGTLQVDSPDSRLWSEIPPQYVREVLQRGRPTVTGVLLQRQGQRPVLYLLLPSTPGPNSPQTLLLAAVEPEAAGLGQFLQPFSLGATGFAELVDDAGTVLATTRADGLFDKADHSDQFATLIQSGRSSAGTCHGCHQENPAKGKEQQVLAFAPLKVAPWGVAIRQSETEALASARALQTRFFLLGLTSLCGIIVVSWGASRRLAQSAAQLQARASSMAKGDLETPVPMARGAEMIRLANTLEETRQGLLHSWRELERSNRELERRLETKTQELGSVVRASESLVLGGGPETLLGFIVRIAAQAFRADAAALFLLDSQRDGLVAKASTGYDIHALAQVVLQPGEGIVGKVFRSGQPAMSNHPAEVERLLVDLSDENRRYLLWARGGHVPHSFLCVPLESRGQALGCLFLAGFREPLAFSSSNLELALTYARIASSLQENLRLLHDTSQAEALRRADQIKTEFFSNTSHELQTPLASLKASLELLPPALCSGDSEAWIALVENARRSAERLQRLVGDLIDVARLQSLHMKLELDVIDLGEVVQQAVAKFVPLTDNKGQVLRPFAPEGPALVTADQRRVEQVLGNLLMNAHQYTPEGGHITVTLRDEGDEVVVSVADTGPGIPPQDKVRLFERFYRGAADGTASGLGLGLAIAKGLVELHGGRIWVESGQAKGSIFSFSLPRASPNEDPDR